MKTWNDQGQKTTSSGGNRYMGIYFKNLFIINLWAFISFFALGIMTADVYAQPNDSSPNQTETDINIPATAYPFTGEIIGDDVHMRSGPGTNFYSCGKVNNKDAVSVVGEQSGWSTIIPPPGTFSWISMQYVVVSISDPSVGIVTGDDIGVYAGCDTVLPMHSTSKQVNLQRGSRVQLLGEEKDGYFKIAPPKGSFLWVSSQYIRRAPEGAAAPGVMPEQQTAVDSNKPQAALPGPSELQQLNLYYTLQKKVQAEVAKPIEEQDYTSIKKSLIDIKNAKEAGKAVRYAEYLLTRIEGYELAKRISSEVKQQDKTLEAVTTRIQKSREQRLSELNNLGKYAVIGKCESSTVYNNTAQGVRYRIIGKEGTLLCYAQAAGAMIHKDMTPFLGKQVGLIGTITAHAPINHALVEFTDIVLLE